LSDFSAAAATFTAGRIRIAHCIHPSISPASLSSASLKMDSAEIAPEALPLRPWFVYLLRCSNGCLYTGITTDVEERLRVHNAGKGSAYVRAHRPARLVGFIAAGSRSAASILEYQIKSLSRARKLALVQQWNTKACRPAAS
jgi:putative endonuclease